MLLSRAVEAVVVASIWSVILVGAVVAVQGLFGRWLTAQWRYGLWALVLLRLLLIFVEVPVVSKPKAAPAGEVSPDLQQGALAATTAAAATLVGQARATVTQRNWWSYAGRVWAAGATGLAAVIVAQSLRLRRAVSRGRMLTDPGALKLLETCRSQIGIRSWLVPVETDAAPGPLLMGAIRPNLLLPVGYAGRAGDQQLRHVFLHELAHLKRADIWVGWLMNLLLVIHWFNPVLWLIRRRVLNDRECACDSTALKWLDAPEQISYGHTLLNIAQHAALPAGWSPGMASILEASSSLQRRIEMIANNSRRRSAGIVGAAVTAALTVLCASTFAAPGARPAELKYTHLVVFEPADDFNPQTPRELLDVFNGVCRVATGYFRTKPQNGKLVGSICANNPDKLKSAFAAEPRLKWVSCEQLTAEKFAAHSARRQESMPGAAGDSAPPDYTHLVTFEPAGGFSPQTPKELLSVFNGVCSVATGYFRTRPQDGKLIGSICTTDPNKLKDDLAREPRLKFIDAVELTPRMFEQHSARKQESLR